MILSRRRLVVLVVLVALAASLGAVANARAQDDEGDDVAEPPPWQASPATVFLRRIVSAATGEPVAGATVLLFAEVPHPEPGFGTPVARGTSGPDGWVRIDASAFYAREVEAHGPPTWTFVDAEGFAPAGDMSALVPGRPPAGGTDWEIEPGATVRVALVDPLDRPVSGALVGWLLGCGHTPDQRQARTDADGVAVFRDASTTPDGRFWPVADGLRASTGYVEEPFADGEPRRVARLAWSQTVEGTVLAADGRPAAGVAVGSPSWHRGPWARTDREGRFRLVGSEVRTGSSVLVEAGEYPVGPRPPDPQRVTLITFPAPPPGRPAVVRLRPPDAEPEEPPSEPNLIVDVRRAGWPTSSARSTTTVVAVRDRDAWTAVEAVGEDGSARLAVLPGRYAVEAQATREAGGIVHARARADVVVPGTGAARTALDLPPPAVQPIEVDGAAKAPFLDTVELVADGATTVLPHEDANAFDVFLPADRDVFVRVTQGARTRLVRIDRTPLAPGARAPVLRIAPFATIRVVARLVDEEGRPLAGWLSPALESRPADEERPTGRPASESPAATIGPDQPLRLVAWPQDDARWSPRSVDVPEPVAATDPVDLGEVRFARRTPALTVRRPLAGSTQIVVRLTRGARSVERRLGLDGGPGGDVARIVDPWWRPGLLAAGTVVRVAPDSTDDRASAAVLRRLEGAGPWTVDPPAGALEVRVTDESGASLESWAAHVDGVGYVGGGARLEIDALVPGDHEAIVDAEGRVPRRLRFTLADGDRRAWSVVLRAAPASPR